jgi:hypothetical protein
MSYAAPSSKGGASARHTTNELCHGNIGGKIRRFSSGWQSVLTHPFYANYRLLSPELPLSRYPTVHDPKPPRDTLRPKLM